MQMGLNVPHKKKYLKKRKKKEWKKRKKKKGTENKFSKKLMALHSLEVQNFKISSQYASSTLYENSELF